MRLRITTDKGTVADVECVLDIHGDGSLSVGDGRQGPDKGQLVLLGAVRDAVDELEGAGALPAACVFALLTDDGADAEDVDLDPTKLDFYSVYDMNRLHDHVRTAVNELAERVGELD